MYWYLYIYNAQATVFGNPFLVATKRNPYEIAKKNQNNTKKWSYLILQGGLCTHD